MQRSDAYHNELCENGKKLLIQKHDWLERMVLRVSKEEACALIKFKSKKELFFVKII